MIIVTGANGFIGSALVRDLNARGEKEILAVDAVSIHERTGPLSHAQYSEFIHSSKLMKWLESHCPKVIFHLGACSSTTEKNWDYLYQNNTLYSQKLFEYCRDQNIPFFYASSGAVYGDGQKGFDDATDTQTFAPSNLYGKSKWMFDIWAMEQKLTPPQWAGFRFFNVYGPNEYHKGEMASVVFKAYHQIKENGRIRLFRSHREDYADGEQLRDFVYVKDITNWIIAFWKNTQAQSGLFNMGYGRARTWLDLARATFSAMGKELQIEWIDMPVDIRDQYQYRTEAKMDRLFQHGMPAPAFSLEEGIRDYVQNYLDQPDPYL